jgi:hypothetical protein
MDDEHCTWRFVTSCATRLTSPTFTDSDPSVIGNTAHSYYCVVKAIYGGLSADASAAWVSSVSSWRREADRIRGLAPPKHPSPTRYLKRVYCT